MRRRKEQQLSRGTIRVGWRLRSGGCVQVLAGLRGFLFVPATAKRRSRGQQQASRIRGARGEGGKRRIRARSSRTVADDAPIRDTSSIQYPYIRRAARHCYYDIQRSGAYQVGIKALLLAADYLYYKCCIIIPHAPES